jgi:ankyrin repeat protein
MQSLTSHFFRAAAWAKIIDKDNALQLAARHGHARTVKALLEAGADVHADDDLALRIAAWWGRTDTVKALLEAGADAHARDDQAQRWAADGKHMDTVKLLEQWLAPRQNKPLSP